MYVFVSWAYTDVAEKAEEQRVNWLQSLKEQGEEELIARLTTEFCLPEYAAFKEAQQEEQLNMDALNANLLAVRFVIPQMERVVTYQLAKRMPASDKLPVSLACRSLLLNTFKGEWTGDLHNRGTGRLVFVGMQGVHTFLQDLAVACAAMGEPLPVDLWQGQTCIEMPVDGQMRKLVDACAFHKQGEPDYEKYRDLVLGWMGRGSSAERDSAVLLATGFRLGLKGT